MGTVVVLRKDPRGTGEESSPWGGRRVGLGGLSAADGNEGEAFILPAASSRLVNAGPKVREHGCSQRQGFVMLREVVDAIATRLTRQLAGKVESSANVSSPTVFCPR